MNEIKERPCGIRSQMLESVLPQINLINRVYLGVYIDNSIFGFEAILISSTRIVPDHILLLEIYLMMQN